jgi:hypothetical protein
MSTPSAARLVKTRTGHGSPRSNAATGSEIAPTIDETDA